MRYTRRVLVHDNALLFPVMDQAVSKSSSGETPGVSWLAGRKKFVTRR